MTCERRYDKYGAEGDYDINEPSDGPLTEEEWARIDAEMDARYIVICEDCGEVLEHQGAHHQKGCAP